MAGKKRPHIMYSMIDEERWSQRIWKEQCPHEMIFGQHRCQGVEGHKGVHWCFNAAGEFEYEDNDADSTENGCSGTIPPGHQHYRTPLEMQKHYHILHYEDSEVIDPVVLARLKRGRLQANESRIVPVSPEEEARFPPPTEAEHPEGPPKVG